jgi:hypothetical protein
VSYNPNFRGSQAKSSLKVETNFVNATGAFLAKGAVVSVTPTGQIDDIDIFDGDSVARLVGITSVDMPSAASGGVTLSGRVEELPTSFAVGDAIYVAIDGTLTNVKPDYGVGGFTAGYFVIFVGIIVKNEFNPSLKDLLVNLTVVGQL